MKYRPEIDGLRAFAVIAVVLFHSEIIYSGFNLFKGGFLGVDIFFVISGYLITSIILGELDKKTFTLRDFYKRRSRRILPALFAVVVVTLPLAYLWLLPARTVSFARSIIATVFFYSNFHFYGEAGYFDISGSEKPFLHAWSLSIEEQFYILFPLIMVVLWRYAKTHLLIIIICGFVLSLVIATASSPVFSDASYFLLPSRMWELLAGSILAIMEKNAGCRRITAFPSVFTTVGLFLLVGSVSLFDEHVVHPSIYTLFPIAGTMMIIWFAKEGDWVTKILSYKPVVAVGLISYSFYLWHFPIFALSRIKNPEETISQRKVEQIALALALSVVTYFFIEKPMRNKVLIPWRKFLWIVIPCGAGIILFSASAIVSEGFRWRFTPEELRSFPENRAEFGKYVRKRFMGLHLSEFDNSNPNTKLLVIGDSYGQDLINAIFESNLSDNLQISTFSIPKSCGNLFLHYDFTDNIEPDQREKCTETISYRNKSLQSLIKQADVIWLASAWSDWVVELLPESINNIEETTNATVLVLGRKAFGLVDHMKLIKIPLILRPSHHLILSQNNMELMQRDKTILWPYNYIDTQELISTPSGRTIVFDSKGNLLSYDGSHLTRDGAVFLGNKLKEHELVKSCLGIQE